MSASGLYPRFPAVSLPSQAEFVEFRRAAQDLLDARHVHESGLTTRGDRLRHAGTCAPCLRRALFVSETAHWEQLPDGRRTPEWAAALECDCADRLGNRARAVVHFAQSVAGLRPWTRLLLFGPPDRLHGRLAALAGETMTLAALEPRTEDMGFRLAAASATCHLAVAVDCLDRVPPLRPALAEFRRVLVPGGSLVFTVPFRYEAQRTVSRADLPRRADGRLPAAFRAPVHEIGWDVLDWLRDAGFASAAAHCYWSNELGYLGPFNMILHAVR